MGLFGSKKIADNAGIRRVTVYYRFDGPFANANSLSQAPMSTKDMLLLISKIDDRKLASKIEGYMRNYEVIVKGKTDMPRFKTQNEF